MCFYCVIRGLPRYKKKVVVSRKINVSPREMNLRLCNYVSPRTG